MFKGSRHQVHALLPERERGREGERERDYTVVPAKKGRKIRDMKYKTNTQAADRAPATGFFSPV